MSGRRNVIQIIGLESLWMGNTGRKHQMMLQNPPSGQEDQEKEANQWQREAWNSRTSTVLQYQASNTGLSLPALHLLHLSAPSNLTPAHKTDSKLSLTLTSNSLLLPYPPLKWGAPHYLTSCLLPSAFHIHKYLFSAAIYPYSLSNLALWVVLLYGLLYPNSPQPHCAWCTINYAGTTTATSH